MKRDPRDLLGEFRALAPARKPIPLQRWSLRRVGLAAVVFGAIAVAVASAVQPFSRPRTAEFTSAMRHRPLDNPGRTGRPVGGAGALRGRAPLGLVGWRRRHPSGHAKFWLDSDQAGPQAVTITLSATCDTSGTRRIPSHQPRARRFERPLTLRPQFTDLRFYTFPGGCATYRYHFAHGASPQLAIPADGAVAFMPRARLVAYIEKTEGLALCGRGAPCPG
jgi:hypothetical protein